MTATAATTLNLRLLLEEMIERDASDLHVTASDRPKLRIDGDIVDSKVDGLNSHTLAQTIPPRLGRSLIPWLSARSPT